MPRKPKSITKFSNRCFKRHIAIHFKQHKDYTRHFFICTVCNDRYWIDVPKNFDLPKLLKDNLGSDCGHSFYYKHIKF